MLQVESVLPQKLLQNQNTKSKQSKYIIISLDFALFHFIMLFLGNDREAPSFITQLSDLNLEDHLGDTTAAHVVSVFPLPVTHITVSHKSESTCDRTRREQKEENRYRSICWCSSCVTWSTYTGFEAQEKDTYLSYLPTPIPRRILQKLWRKTIFN